MVQAIQICLKNAAAAIFSTTIGFLLMAPVWQSYWHRPPSAGFLIAGGIAIAVAAIFASLTARTELNWAAISTGVTIGMFALAATVLMQILLPRPVLLTVVTPVGLASVAVLVTTDGGRPLHVPSFLDTSRFVSFLHLLQGAILFGVALPASIAWRWPRPFAAALMCSALMLWHWWRGCPLTLAENRYRVREHAPIIPPDEGFIREILGKLGIPVLGTAVTTTLHGIALVLCAWWGIEWLMSFFARR